MLTASPMAPVTSARAVKLVSNPRRADSIPVALDVIFDVVPPVTSILETTTETASDAAGTVSTSSFSENAADAVTRADASASPFTAAIKPAWISASVASSASTV